MVGLEPPGNVRRELALFRRRIFAALGAGSALAFPEIVPLGFLRWPEPKPKGMKRRQLDDALEVSWKSVAGRFVFEGIVELDDGLYLGLGGPLRSLAESSCGALSTLGFRPEPEPPLTAARGLFLCASPEGGTAQPGGLELELQVEGLGAPAPSFADATLCLLRLDARGDARVALTWTLIARGKRRTGPGPRIAAAP
ncbi:MAG TPA: hypothetical protein VMC79_16305 [Rectinemataceae bacterium]|nr:hypothetical protein [Rectinemataceae bacterium]